MYLFLNQCHIIGTVDKNSYLCMGLFSERWYSLSVVSEHSYFARFTVPYSVYCGTGNVADYL